MPRPTARWWSETTECIRHVGPETHSRERDAGGATSRTHRCQRSGDNSRTSAAGMGPDSSRPPRCSHRRGCVTCAAGGTTRVGTGTGAARPAAAGTTETTMPPSTSPVILRATWAQLVPPTSVEPSVRSAAGGQLAVKRRRRVRVSQERHNPHTPTRRGGCQNRLRLKSTFLATVLHTLLTS